MSSSLFHVFRISGSGSGQVDRSSIQVNFINGQQFMWYSELTNKTTTFSQSPAFSFVVESVFTTCTMKLYVVSLKAASNSLVLTSCLWEMISVLFLPSLQPHYGSRLVWGEKHTDVRSPDLLIYSSGSRRNVCTAADYFYFILLYTTRPHLREKCCFTTFYTYLRVLVLILTHKRR